MRRIHSKTRKSQSILEYIVYLTAVAILIVAGTFGLFKPGLQLGMGRVQAVATENILNDRQAPADIRQQEYYQSSSEYLDNPPAQAGQMDPYVPEGEPGYAGREMTTNEYGGPEVARAYRYHEGPSDMTDIPEDGTVVGEDENRLPVYPDDFPQFHEKESNVYGLHPYLKAN